MEIKIDGRELPFPELDTLTFREAQFIKRATGITLGKFQEAFEAGDTDMIMGLALVALYRADGASNIDALLDTKIASIEVIAPEDEEEQHDPPAQAGDQPAADDASDA